MVTPPARSTVTGNALATASGTSRIDYLFAPESTRVWLAHFLIEADRDRVRFSGEGTELSCEIGDIQPGGTDLVVLYSSHETLSRDLTIGDLLRRRGVRVLCQSSLAARLGTDKFAMKRFFDASGIPSPPWVCAGQRWPAGRSGDEMLVVKDRHGTQSHGMRLCRADDCDLGRDQFAELYRDGVEYSVVVYRDPDRCVLFPPVWKGPTSTELVPPWRRVRLCPHLDTDPAVSASLLSLSGRIADAIGCIGPVEIEYLVTADTALVLEINPRVSGTMRISALATGLPIFSLPALAQVRGVLPPVRFAAEAPYAGAPFVDAAAGVFATSRLTAVADTQADLRSLFQQTLGTVPAALGRPMG